MLAVIEIGLAVWAWRRGWKAWVLLPFGILLGIGVFLVVAKIINFTNLWVLISLDVVAIAILILMGIKPRNEFQPYSIENNSLRAVTPADKKVLNHPIVPAKSDVNEQVIPGEIEPAVQSQPATQSVFSPFTAKLILPDNSEILLTEPVKIVGRNEFDKVVSPEALKYISRNHFLVRSDNGKYFVEDLNSTNGTKANGVQINGSRIELDSGDRIQVADQLEIIFNK